MSLSGAIQPVFIQFEPESRGSTEKIDILGAEHMAQPFTRTINEHILEIRYKPNAHLLDFRGEPATSISQHMELTEWRIDENRVDVYSKDQAVRFFAAFRNSGAVMRNTSLADFFQIKQRNLSVIYSPLSHYRTQ
jgi:hypothetical protein